MSDESTTTQPLLPEFREMGIAAVRLLQGVVYSDDDAWDIMLSNQSELTEYFHRIGLQLVIDESDGLGYLRQVEEEDRSGGYERLPRLFRRSSLGYDSTLLAVLLRDEYRRFEEEDIDNERCVVTLEQLLNDWRMFFPDSLDDVQLRRKLVAAMAKLDRLRLVRPFQRDSQSWEVRRILKSRLPIQKLEELREQLLAAVESESDAPNRKRAPK